MELVTPPWRIDRSFVEMRRRGALALFGFAAFGVGACYQITNGLRIESRVQPTRPSGLSRFLEAVVSPHHDLVVIAPAPGPSTRDSQPAWRDRRGVGLVSSRWDLE
jgi:hypothetical protein